MYLLLFCSYFFYAGALAFYRLFFHPLHKYPGPILAALTDWYELYYNIVKGGALVTKIDNLHKLHGPVIRIGPNTLHFNERHAYHDIYTYGSALVKDPGFYFGFMAHGPQGLVSTCDPEDAKNRRSLLGPMFSRRAVLELEFTVQLKVNQLISLLKECSTSSDSGIQMAMAYRSITTDVITEYCFAESANTLTPGFDHPIQLSVRDLLKRIWIQRHFPFLNSLTSKAPQKLVRWLLPGYKSYVEMKNQYERQIDGLLKNPDSLSGTNHETIYHHLLNPKDQAPLSRKTLVDEAFTLVSAGSETVGGVCTVGTFYALKNPTIYRKLLEELCKAWPDKDIPMSYMALEKLPYLTAFIKEALRFSIGVCHPLPRIVGASTEIGGYRIPSGTVVEMSPVFLHMNPDVFPDPYTFNPDRWLTGSTSEMMLDLAPFSKGPRICLAWCELYLIFGNIFRNFRMTLLDTGS
ncbi:cytochrome P450 [Lentinula guzmanii]|uniref:Cytochrome P450 n=1 Tax=Lentinula guzmanii TaxID=2804957 RepID=A0AA38JQ76_9AGAR|nr:cytochrome P450 [Lentinula guzmanii]